MILNIKQSIIAFLIGTLLLSSVPFSAYAEEVQVETVKYDNIVLMIQQVYEQCEAAYKEQCYQEKINQVKTTAEQYLGVPYVWGGTSPRGFDCSGLTQYVYNECGISIPRTAGTQKNVGESVALGELVCGDLIFWGSHHVGIYIGDGLYIHAPHSGDVVRVAEVAKRPPTSAKRFIFRE